MPALALTDHDGLYGAVEFWWIARDAGLHPIIGAEVTLNDGAHPSTGSGHGASDFDTPGDDSAGSVAFPLATAGDCPECEAQRGGGDQEGLVMEPDGGRERSYHLDHYIFDSGEERKLFKMLLTHERVEEIYFTGGITDPAHNEFFVEYCDEVAGQWRRYFPDFFLRLAGDGRMVIEVKRQDQIEPPNVKAKDTAARQVFETLNDIFYHVKPDDEIRRGEIHDIFRRVAPHAG